MGNQNEQPAPLDDKNPGCNSGDVAKPLRLAAAWSWRILVICGVIALGLWIMQPIKKIVIAVAIALLLSLLITPFVRILRRAKLGRTFSAVLGLLLGVFIVGGLISLALDQLIKNVGSLAAQTFEGIDQLFDWMNTVSFAQDWQAHDFLHQIQTELLRALKEHGSVLAFEAWNIASSAIGIAAAALIMLFCLFFFLRDGRRMWVWVLRMFPDGVRNQVNEAAIRGWVTLGSYVKTQVQVAAIDAVGIGLGAVFLGVPLAIPITVLVFFGSFIPIVGAFVSGAVAVFIALVNNGLTNAVIMLIVVVAVQQIEGHVLQPWMMGSAVAVHPVAIVLAVAIGTVVAGIPGALFSVPLVAFLNVVFLYLHGHDPMPQLDSDQSRPGGAPGTLNKEIAASYKRGKHENKKRQKSV